MCRAARAARARVPGENRGTVLIETRVVLVENVRVTQPMSTSREEFEAAAAMARSGADSALPGDDVLLARAAAASGAVLKG